MVLAEPSAMLLGPTPAEDVRLGPAVAGLEEAEVARRVAAALEAVGMTARRDVPCEALSVGERKRVALAAAFALEPAAMVLDEPFAFLDDAQEAALWEAIDRRRATGAAFLILSGRREVGRRCDRTWALAEGVARAVV
jgi:biotin transport system ATP-binding protein